MKSIEKEVEDLASDFTFVPVWMRKEAVAAWAPNVRLERLQSQTERLQSQTERLLEQRETARAAIRELLKEKSEEEVHKYLVSVGLA